MSDWPDAGAEAQQHASRLLAAWRADRNVETLRRAVEMLRHSALVSTDPGARLTARANLSACLQLLYELEEDSVEVAADYLAEAIATIRELVAELPDGTMRRRQRANLANALRLRHDATVDAEAVLEGVSVARDSLDPSDPAATRAERSSTLALLLRARFVRFGTVGDVDEAVGLLREAARDARPESRHLIMSNLADTLGVRGYRLQQKQDLFEAVGLARESLDDCRADERGGLLTNAGLALLELFRITADAEHVNAAVTMLSAAMDEHTPAVELSARLTNLSRAHRLAFSSTADRADLDDAVSLARKALVHAEQAQDWIQSAATLGRALWARYEALADHADAEESVELRTRIAWQRSGAPGDRLDSARMVGDCATGLGRHQLASEMYSLAQDLAAVLGLLGLDRRSQERETARLSGLASDAAASYLELGEPGFALFEVDRGRAVLWSELRKLRVALPATSTLGNWVDLLRDP